MNFIKELEWRGMIQDMMPGVEEQLSKEMCTAYVGIDPTADSLHIGHLVGVMILKHFQACGHKPLFLVGGATGMIGDPSGKSAERNLLDEQSLRHNQESIKKQLSRLIDFESELNNSAELVNNYDWMKEQSFLGFIRDIGKLITVNYMMAKDSVKKRFSGDGEGMSFTEFTYQLVQGFDFLYLYEHKNCKIQLGGSDQWGNITTGTELIRRKLGGEAWGITCPLIKKADGTKFGKTESGNIWLDRRYTSPYKFYQFWLNVSDEDANSYIRIFTMLDKNTIDSIIEKHNVAPHERLLQKALAKEITTMIHSKEDFETAVAASTILFGNSVGEDLQKLDEKTFLEIFDGVPMYKISKTEVLSGINVLDFLAERTQAFPSKGDLRRTIKGNGLSINKEKVTSEDLTINETFLIKDKYVLVQKGKKNYILIIAE